MTVSEVLIHAPSPRGRGRLHLTVAITAAWSLGLGCWPGVATVAPVTGVGTSSGRNLVEVDCPVVV